MPRKLPTLIAIAVVVLIAGGVGAMFAWDARRDGVIANDVRIGPIEVGGMTRAQAHTAITDRLVKPLHRTLVIQAADRSFALSARDAQLSADIEAMLDAALRRSRAGGVLARTWRAISGRGIGARIAPEVAYSDRAVQRMVDRVRVAVGRPAKDAKVNFQPGRLTIRAARSAARSTARGCAPASAARSCRTPTGASSPRRSSASGRRVTGDRLAA